MGSDRSVQFVCFFRRKITAKRIVTPVATPWRDIHEPRVLECSNVRNPMDTLPASSEGRDFCPQPDRLSHGGLGGCIMVQVAVNRKQNPINANSLSILCWWWRFYSGIRCPPNTKYQTDPTQRFCLRLAIVTAKYYNPLNRRRIALIPGPVSGAQSPHRDLNRRCHSVSAVICVSISG